MRAYRNAARKLPPTITQLLEIPHFDPKRVQALYDRLRVTSLEQLAEAARSGRIRALETVGDIDILVSASAAAAVMERFVRYDEVAEVLAHGETRATVMLRCGLQVDLRVVEPDSHGAALLYFTGSKAHNIALRRIAQSLGLKLGEYGLFRGNRRSTGATEESVYRALGLPWIAPELRENRGEIEAACAGRLPPLMERTGWIPSACAARWSGSTCSTPNSRALRC